MLDGITSGELVLSSSSLSPLSRRLTSSLVTPGTSCFNHTSCNHYPCRDFMRHSKAVSHSSPTERNFVQTAFKSCTAFKDISNQQWKKGVFQHRINTLLANQEVSEAIGCGDWLMQWPLILCEGLQSRNKKKQGKKSFKKKWHNVGMKGRLVLSTVLLLIKSFCKRAQY